jgi:hypothetical protein
MLINDTPATPLLKHALDVNRRRCALGISADPAGSRGSPAGPMGRIGPAPAGPRRLWVEGQRGRPAERDEFLDGQRRLPRFGPAGAGLLAAAASTHALFLHWSRRVVWRYRISPPGRRCHSATRPLPGRASPSRGSAPAGIPGLTERRPLARRTRSARQPLDPGHVDPAVPGCGRSARRGRPTVRPDDLFWCRLKSQ